MPLPVSTSLRELVADERSGAVDDMLPILRVAMDRYKCNAHVAVDRISKHMKEIGRPLNERTMRALTYAAVKIS